MYVMLVFFCKGMIDTYPASEVVNSAVRLCFICEVTTKSLK